MMELGPNVAAELICFYPLKMPYFQKNIQLCQMNIISLSNKPYVNEVNLREQKLPLRYYQPLDFLYTSLKGLDLLML